MLANIPWIIVPVILYNILAFFGAGDGGQLPFDNIVFNIPLIKGGVCAIQWEHVILGLALIALFIELMKATRIANTALVDHGLSMFVFILCLIEFLVFKQAGTGTFLLLTLAALIDVVAGFSIGMRAARRDFGVGSGAAGL